MSPGTAGDAKYEKDLLGPVSTSFHHEYDLNKNCCFSILNRTIVGLARISFFNWWVVKLFVHCCCFLLKVRTFRQFCNSCLQIRTSLGRACSQIQINRRRNAFNNTNAFRNKKDNVYKYIYFISRDSSAICVTFLQIICCCSRCTLTEIHFEIMNVLFKQTWNRI